MNACCEGLVRLTILTSLLIGLSLVATSCRRSSVEEKPAPAADTPVPERLKGFVGMWEYRRGEGERPPYPNERTALNFRGDGTCRCVIMRFRYHFGDDGLLTSYNTWGSEEVEGRFTIADDRLEVRLPEKHSGYCSDGAIRNKEASSFVVEPKEGEKYSFTRVEKND